MFFEVKTVKKEIEKEFNDVFDDIFGQDFLKESRNLHKDLAGSKDAFVLNDDGVVKIVVEMAGTKKENIKIVFDKDILTILTTNPEREAETKRKFEVKASLYDVRSITTKYEDGLLTLTIPKIKKEETKPIEINL